MLARREHSRYELQRKLVAKGEDPEAAAAVIAQLAAEQLQDDARFIASYIRQRTAAGYGPRRILGELAQRGIREPPEQLANENSSEWLQALTQAWRKKFGGKPPADNTARAKQSRFLLYRGFSPEQIHSFLSRRGEVDENDD